MAGVTVPAILEESLSLEDGTQGPSLAAALQFDQNTISNLYSCTADNGEFCFNFTEKGVAYGEKEATQQQATVTFKVLMLWLNILK